MKVHWTDTAKAHLHAISDYISSDSPAYARNMIDRLTKRSKKISAFPLSGRMVPEFGTEQIREVIEGPYRIIYYIKSLQIDVLAVVHGSKDLFKSF